MTLKSILFIEKSMLSGGDKKYDFGSDPLPPFETNFVLQATLNFINGPLQSSEFENIYQTKSKHHRLDLEKTSTMVRICFGCIRINLLCILAILHTGAT